jgi:transcriptional regulator GlxA family with amidase domain
MIELVILTEENIEEIAEKTGYDAKQLFESYYRAKVKNQQTYVVISASRLRASIKSHLGTSVVLEEEGGVMPCL